MIGLALVGSGALSRPGGYPVSRREAFSRSEYERFTFDLGEGEIAVLFRYGGIGDRDYPVECVFLDADGTRALPPRGAPQKGLSVALPGGVKKL